MTEHQTAAEVAAAFRCSSRKVRAEAVKLGVGVNLRGRAGYRFTAEDVAALAAAMRPAPPVRQRRPRRRAS